MVENYRFTNFESRPNGALEITAAAKEREHMMNILRQEFESDRAAEKKKRSGLLRTLLASLFLS